MADKKIIAVVGATGAQGGGLVRAICSDPDSPFSARALTRDPNSDGAKALAALGAEVVAADIDDEASVRSAFEGAYGAFCVTFWGRSAARTASSASRSRSATRSCRAWRPRTSARPPTPSSVAGEHLGGADFAAAFAKALGEPVEYNEVSPDTYRGFGFPGADDIGNMFQFKHDFEDEYRAPRDPAEARKLNPALQSFETWLGENLSRIPIA